jgi:hypothetical protein
MKFASNFGHHQTLIGDAAAIEWQKARRDAVIICVSI